ncbi:hypothetical protein DS2_17392 [Catenovulum agarivorans DS-2]|uniref:TPR repeat-containing protein n=1 Tax=Catenovulum agarivorans DS-2 TaxID=1328313 RepID=W7Q6P3_9ALTE|nr:tetratricopeptide repeat protein [Catenovulum agarivorans]EWH08464.1 hypothetical protein DS2_17392 [Catenovulum agarivorans DS-2]
MKFTILLLLNTVFFSCSSLAHINTHDTHKHDKPERSLSTLSFTELEHHIKNNKFIVAQQYSHNKLLNELKKRANASPAKNYFWQASLLQRAHKFQSSLAVLEQYLHHHPADIDALLLRANIETVIGKYDKALATCLSLAGLHSVELSMVCTLDVKMQTQPLEPIIKQLSTSPVRQGSSELALFTQELYATALFLDGQYQLALAELEPIMHNQLASSTWILYADIQMQLKQPHKIVESFGQLELNNQDIPDALLVRLAHAAPHKWSTTAKQRIEERLKQDAENYSDSLAYYFYFVAKEPVRALYWAKLQSQLSSLKMDNWLYQKIHRELRVQLQASTDK